MKYRIYFVLVFALMHKVGSCKTDVFFHVKGTHRKKTINVLQIFAPEALPVVH